jgi:pimeloyl-ACP methyl ester carboxylesterase
METLYLLCGVLCDEEVWQGQLPALRAQYDVRVVSFQAFDTLAAMAEHVLAGAPEQISLAGHSMGGRVALEVYRRAPSRVARLALLDTGFEPPSQDEVPKRGAMVNRAVAEGIEAIAETWARPMIGRSNQDDAELLARIVRMVGRMSPQIYARQTRALLSRPNAADVLATITCPTLVLCGQEDTWSPPERHQQMAEMISGAQLRLIDHCGHMSMMERPAAVQAALTEWMAAAAGCQMPPKARYLISRYSSMP